MKIYEVWYMRPEWLLKGMMGAEPNPLDLETTHIKLMDIDMPREAALEAIYWQLQGEVWSPNGEAREMIRSKGLGHTSMSVGDVIVDPDGGVHLVGNFGFKKLELK